MIEDVSRIDFYPHVYNKLYQIGYHADLNYSHAYGLIELMCRELEFDTILDIGSGVGAGVEKLMAMGKSAIGLETSFLAVTRSNQYKRPCLWGEVTRIPFPNDHVDIVMSTDMMEHLRPEDVEQAISEITRVAAKYTAHKICPMDEAAGWGKRVGVENLHLTVKPLDWWVEKFLLAKEGTLVHQAGDMFVIKYGE
jgi:ubiquinone/menaquinone biosynthesis C-methylase UbiE